MSQTVALIREDDSARYVYITVAGVDPLDYTISDEHFAPLARFTDGAAAFDYAYRAIGLEPGDNE